MKYQIALQYLLAQTCLVNYLRIDKNISHNDFIEKLKNKMIEEEKIIETHLKSLNLELYDFYSFCLTILSRFIISSNKQLLLYDHFDNNIAQEIWTGRAMFVNYIIQILSDSRNMSDKTEIRTLETVQRELVETWMKIVEQIPIIKEYYSFFESLF